MAQSQISQANVLAMEMSYADLCRKLLDVEHSLEWCMQVGPLAKDMDCPGCVRSCREVYCAKAMEKKIWRCPQKGCQNVVSLREGSYFSELQVKSEVIMRLIHLWVHKTSVGKAATKLGITDKVAIGWYNFNCEVCAHYFLDHPSVGVGGLKAIVSKNNTNLNFCINLCIICSIKEQCKF